MADLYLKLALIIFIYMSIVFLIATKLKNNGIVDIAWPFGFVTIAISSLILTKNDSLTAIVVSILTVLWGARLGLYLLKRAIGKPEDFRYANFRKQWGKNVILISFFRVYMLQGTIMLIVSYPIIVAAANANSSYNIAFVVIGALIWLIGYFFQVVGDAQLARFKKNRKSNEQVLQTGLWAYTRHPNYFGEASMWWGIAFIVLPVSYGFFGILTALAMNFLLVKVSGVPFLDRRYAQNEAYQHYKKRTNRFIPLPPKNL